MFFRARLQKQTGKVKTPAQKTKEHILPSKSKLLRALSALSLVVGFIVGPLLFAIPSAQANPSGLTVEVYNVLGQNGSPYIPQGASPILTTNVPNIDFQWGSGGVAGTSNTEDVIVLYKGWITSDTTQDISFLATADDGTMLFIDGNLVTSDWVDKGGGGTTSAPVSFTAGVSRSIVLMYYENGGGAWVQLSWNKSGSMQVIPASAFQYVTPPPPEVLSIGAPTNLTVIDNDSSTVLAWSAPTEGTRQPERYAINFTCEGCNGWGIATGNVGDANSLNTTITINHEVFNSLKPSGTTWTFTIRSDNDTLRLYSSLSNAVTIKVGKTAEELAAIQAAADAESARLAAIAAEAARVAEIARLAEVARLQAEAAALLAEQQAAALAAQQAEEARLEAIRVAAEQAATAEQARLAEIERQRLAEVARVEAERQAAIAAENARLAEVARQAAIAEAARVEAARVEQERLNELARIAAAKAEEERLAAEAAAAKAEEERLAAEAAAAAQAIEDAKAEEEARLEEEKRLAAEKAAAEAEAEAEAQAAIDEGTPEAVDNSVTDALADGKVSSAEVAAVAEIMAADGKVDIKETNQLIEALAADGKVSVADQTAVLAALASDGEVSKEDVAAIVELAGSDGKLSEAEKDIVADALIQSVAPGENLTKEQIQEAGIEYKDLPAETPVEVRQDENGNEIVIIAEVAAALELVSDPGALVDALFSDPGQALLAVASLGADMSTEEREEAGKMVLTVVVAGQAVATALAAAAPVTGGTGSSSGGSSGGGGSGGGAPSGGSATRRRKP